MTLELKTCSITYMGGGRWRVQVKNGPNFSGIVQDPSENLFTQLLALADRIGHPALRQAYRNDIMRHMRKEDKPL